MQIPDCGCTQLNTEQKSSPRPAGKIAASLGLPSLPATAQHPLRSPDADLSALADFLEPSRVLRP